MCRIVRVLSDNAMLVVSGTRIAEEIGTSRSEVWRLVQQLRAMGVEIAGHPATGYRLESVPDLLLPDTLEPLVTRTIFSGHIRHYFRIGSTNTIAMEAAQAGAPEGSVFFAEEQTSGHGRSGHSWHSERSAGIYVSVILRPQISPADVVVLSLMAGLATAAAVEEVIGMRPDLRWPNDLLLPYPRAQNLPEAALSSQNAASPSGGQRKFCGILTELNAEVGRVHYAAVGIGINVNHENFPEKLQPLATSLRIETGRRWSRVQIAGALLQSLDREYRRFLPQYGLTTADPRQDVFRRFEQASSYARGRRVQVEEQGGCTGVTEGLDERGFLRVRTDDGTLRTVLSGGVRAI